MIDLCVLENALPLSLPPRGLSRVQAAEYVGASPSTFDKLISVGRMPRPLRINSRTLWDLRALDRAIGRRAPAEEQPDRSDTSCEMSRRVKTTAEPRLLSRDQAAFYCGLSAPTFAGACPVIPIKIRTRVLYDRQLVDQWIDSLSTTQPQSTSQHEVLKRLDYAYANKRN